MPTGWFERAAAIRANAWGHAANLRRKTDSFGLSFPGPYGRSAIGSITVSRGTCCTLSAWVRLPGGGLSAGDRALPSERNGPKTTWSRPPYYPRRPKRVWLPVRWRITVSPPRCSWTSPCLPVGGWRRLGSSSGDVTWRRRGSFWIESRVHRRSENAVIASGQLRWPEV